jgi:hypothetical protein
MIPTEATEVRFTERGYLVIGADLARALFPTDAVRSWRAAANSACCATSPESKPTPAKPPAPSFDAGRLAVADTANNRVSLFASPPRDGAAVPADAVIGQTGFAANGENEWGLHLRRDRLAIADSGNNRVMIWSLGD